MLQKNDDFKHYVNHVNFTTQIECAWLRAVYSK